MNLEIIVKRFVNDLVNWALTGPSEPGEITFKVLGEAAVAKANITEVVLPPLAEGNPEVVSLRHLSTMEAGTELPIYDEALAIDAASPIMTLKQGVEYTFHLVDMDAAGNKSTPREDVYTPSDQTAPSQPGGFQFNVQGEVEV